MPEGGGASRPGAPGSGPSAGGQLRASARDSVGLARPAFASVWPIPWVHPGGYPIQTIATT